MKKIKRAPRNWRERLAKRLGIRIQDIATTKHQRAKTKPRNWRRKRREAGKRAKLARRHNR